MLNSKIVKLEASELARLSILMILAELNGDDQIKNEGSSLDFKKKMQRHMQEEANAS